MSVCVQRPLDGHRAPDVSFRKDFDAYSPVSPMCFAKSTLGELNKPAHTPGAASASDSESNANRSQNELIF